jgi:periplasmic protein TonB
MFEQTLVESSDERVGVLSSIHWVVAVAVGVLGFLLWYFLFSLLAGQPASHGTLVTQSIFFGFVPFFITVLMLCYTWVDSHHIHTKTVPWIIAVIIFWVVGFLVYLIFSAKRTKHYRRATMPIAYIIEAIIIGIAILIPLLHTQVLPKAQLLTFLAVPPPPPPPPPPAPPAPKIVVHQVSMADLMKAPTVIPKKIAVVHDQPHPPMSAGVVGGVAGGMPGGSAGGVLGGLIGSTAPPPPPKAKVPQQIRVGGEVEQAKLIYGPKPTYPAIAKMARIQGSVKLEALIAKDGTVQDLKVLSGSPMLVQSAMQAVRQWRYEPTMLNGIPVEVVTEIDVDFTLEGE